jgi:hypothetical protein
MEPGEQEALNLQVKVSKLLGVGFVFSLVWIAGIGSLMAFVLGFYARRLIIRSNGRIVGIGMAWWCIILGSIGMIAGPIVLLRA